MLEHIFIIPDGNGRWAKQNKKSLINSYTSATEKCIDTAHYLIERKGIKYVTFCPLSVRNLKRKGVEFLLTAFRPFAEERFKSSFSLSLAESTETKVQFIGDYEKYFPAWLNRVLGEVESKAEKNQKHTLTLLLAYDARAEIVNAAKKLLVENVDPTSLDEEVFGSFLPTAGLPPIDLYLTTAGLTRCHTDWMAHQAYFHVSEKLWPDFTEEDLEEAIKAYERRQF